MSHIVKFSVDFLVYKLWALESGFYPKGHGHLRGVTALDFTQNICKAPIQKFEKTQIIKITLKLIL